MPDAGHLCHMPSHIDAWVGGYKEGIDANIKGVEADEKYVRETGWWWRGGGLICLEFLC